MLGPLLLWMKVDPQVKLFLLAHIHCTINCIIYMTIVVFWLFLSKLTSATTSMMSLLSSSSNVIHYAVDKEIPYFIAGWLFMFGFLGGIYDF